MKFKKLLSLALAVVMVCAVSTTAWAEEDKNIDSDYEKLRQAPDYYSAEYQSFILPNIQAANEYVLDKQKTRSGAQKFLSVTNKRQETTYYCGPAVAEMILGYKGKKLTQSTLAGDNYCGTDTDGETVVYKLTDGLNKALNPKADTYAYVGTWEQSFGSGLIYSIDKNYPVACHVETSYLPIYEGESFGHYVTATGYSYGFTGATNENNVKYNDPHYDDRYFGSHTIDWMIMQDAIDGNAGYFIRKI